MAKLTDLLGDGLTVQQHIDQGHYTDGKKWFYGDNTVVPLRNTEGEYENLLDIASKEATKDYRDNLLNTRLLVKVKAVYGHRWEEFFDADKMVFKPGKRPKLNLFDPNFDPDDCE
ncbi:MAG: hypothetical protein PHF63_00690 [Herbinix sp.]|nr:hypothetical protein [Herbinix sp.]